MLRKGFGRLGGKCYLCKSIMEIAENIDIIGYEWLGEEDGSVMMAAEDSWRGLAVELNELHFVKGAAFVEQLRNIVYWGGFRLVEGETNIFSALGEQSEIVFISCPIRRE